MKRNSSETEKMYSIIHSSLYNTMQITCCTSDDSIYLLGALVLLPHRLLGVLSSIEVHSVQILNTWQQIFQGVARQLNQGLGLRRR